MHPLLDAFASMTLAPLVVYHTALSRGLVCYYEQAEAVAQLLESIAGGPGRAGDIPGQPTPPDLYLGKSLSHRKTITDLHTVSFGLLSLDFNPLHFNEEMARHTRFRGRIAHGFHTASLFSGVLAELTPWCVYLHQEIDFTAPVRSGDIVTVTGRIEEIGLKGVIQVSLVGENQKREVVVRGKAFVEQLKEVYQQGDPPQPA